MTTTKPTILSPWFVVSRMRSEQDKERDGDVAINEWYTCDDEKVWSTDRKQAMLFNSLHSAHRIARADGAHVVVVVDETDHAEYR